MCCKPYISMAAKQRLECEFCHSVYKAQDKFAAHQEYCRARKEQLGRGQEPVDLKQALSQGEKFIKLKKYSERLAEVFMREGVKGAYLLASAAMVEACEALQYPFVLVDGYSVTNDIFASRHVWVEVDGEILDPSISVMRQLVSVLGEVQVRHSKHLPPDVTRIDQDTAEKAASLVNLDYCIDLLRTSSEYFWKHAPQEDQLRHKRRRLVQSQLRYL